MPDRLVTPPSFPDAPEMSQVADELDDYVLFTDLNGIITAANHKAFQEFSQPMIGTPLWDFYELEAHDLPSLLRRYPPDTTHEVTSRHQSGVYYLRLMPLPKAVTPDGGYMFLATNVHPLMQMQKEFEETMEDSRTAWDDAICLFNSLFETAETAIILVDDKFGIVSANKHAGHLFGEGVPLSGRDCRPFVVPGDRGEFDEALRTIRHEEPYTMQVTVITEEEPELPVEITLKKVVLSQFSLIQISFRDISIRVDLEENLQQKVSEVEDISTALRHVIRSVEEEKQEMKEELAQQVMEQVLPALERIAGEQDEDVRQNYKSVIEDQFADFVDGTSDTLNSYILKLTPREIEICRLIQLGRRGKEIAELLSISFETLQTHRKNIRKKLGLKGQRVSLYSFLQQSPIADEQQDADL